MKACHDHGRQCHCSRAVPRGPGHAHTCKHATWRAAAGVALLVCVVPLMSSATVRADQIVTSTINHRGAKIVGFESGELRFRDAAGKLRSAWIDQVELIVVDRGGIFDDFNQAERFLADDQPERAIIRYRRALRSGEDFWSDVAAARLVLASDAAKQLDTAVQSFIRVLRGRWAGPPAGARLIPVEIPKKGGRRTARAVEQLDAALAKNPDDSRRLLLEIVRFEILRRTDDPRVAEAVRRAATLPIPVNARSHRVYEIRLHALRTALTDDGDPAELSSLDRAIRDCTEGALPGFLLLKGETLLRTASTREEIIRASWPFLRIAIHFPDDSRAAEGLYGAASALERLGRVDKAMELLDECLEHKRLTDQTRAIAEAARARIRSGKQPSPG